MALTIDGATVGYDSNNVETALNNLNTKCIQDTIDTMNNSMSTLREYVDSAWVGASAEQFKTNMETDKNNVVQALQETYEILKAELYNAVDAMAEADENLIEGRE